MPETSLTPLVISGIAIIPLTVALIQFIKRFVPDAPPLIWLGAAFVLGVFAQAIAWLTATDVPVSSWGLEQWAVVVVMGVNSGLAAAKTYDEANARPDSLAGRAVRGIAGERS